MHQLRLGEAINIKVKATDSLSNSDRTIDTIKLIIYSPSKSELTLNESVDQLQYIKALSASEVYYPFKPTEVGVYRLSWIVSSGSLTSTRQMLLSVTQ